MYMHAGYREQTKTKTKRYSKMNGSSLPIYEYLHIYARVRRAAITVATEQEERDKQPKKKQYNEPQQRESGINEHQASNSKTQKSSNDSHFPPAHRPSTTPSSTQTSPPKAQIHSNSTSTPVLSILTASPPTNPFLTALVDETGLLPLPALLTSCVELEGEANVIAPS